MDFARYGPTNDVVQAAWNQLPESDRQALRQELREQWKSAEPDRERLRQAGAAVAEAARREPFDEFQLRNSLIVFQHIESTLQQRAEDVLIRHLARMPVEARTTAAVGLLTPFNVRMQRSDDARREAANQPKAFGPPSPQSTPDPFAPTPKPSEQR